MVKAGPLKKKFSLKLEEKKFQKNAATNLEWGGGTKKIFFLRLPLGMKGLFIKGDIYFNKKKIQIYDNVFILEGIKYLGRKRRNKN